MGLGWIFSIAKHVPGEKCVICGDERKALYLSHISGRHYCGDSVCQWQRMLHERLLLEKYEKDKNTTNFRLLVKDTSN